MIRFLLALMMVGAFGQMAGAQEFTGDNFTPATDSADVKADFFRPGRPGRPPGPGWPGGPGGPGGGGRGFYVQWRDANSGQQISNWTYSDSPTCGHGANCACQGQNYCGTYGQGQQAYYWDRGCWQQPRVIVCDVQRAN